MDTQADQATAAWGRSLDPVGAKPPAPTIEGPRRSYSELKVSGDSAGPGEAREFCERHLSPHIPDLVEDAKTVASELVTNACRHSRSRGSRDSIRVSLTLGESCALLVVLDWGPHPESAPPVEDDTFIEGVFEQVGGLGLPMVEALSDKWGYIEDPYGSAYWAFWG